MDLKDLVDKNFDTNIFPMDDHGYIMTVVDGSILLNKITDDVSQKDSIDFVTQLNFGASYGVTNADYLKKLAKYPLIFQTKTSTLYQYQSLTRR